MSLHDELEASLGKDIADICPNRFHDEHQNHCAHYVSHIANIGFSFNCVEYMGGVGEPANIRVHEIFAQCPRVGRWSEADETRQQLIFVTRHDVVDLSRKRMQNIPQKHIGILSNGYIYHYSNSADKVVKQKPDEFLDRFQRAYSGHQELFFGYFPGEDLEIEIDPTGLSIESDVSFELRKQNSGRWYAKPKGGSSGEEFLVGKEFQNESAGYFGLYMPVGEYYGPRFSGDDYQDKIDHWAYLLEATGHCESRNFFNLINTYDRAKFTFGFYQLAAHTPNDNLILFFRSALAAGHLAKYFPDLRVVNGRVHRVGKDHNTITDLETAMNTGPGGAAQLQLFMNYLNPHRWQFDEQEVLQGARLIYGVLTDPKLREDQVLTSVQILTRKMQTYSGWYNLDGETDVVCTIIADIHHQGRGKRAEVQAALNAANKEQALIAIGQDDYLSRTKELARKIDSLRSQGKLGAKRYNEALNEFH